MNNHKQYGGRLIPAVLTILFFILLSLSPVFAIQIMSNSTKGVELTEKEPASMTIKNEQKQTIAVKVDITGKDSCKETIKAMPRFFTVASEEFQVIKVFAKKKVDGCKISFTSESEEDDQKGSNTVKTRFIISLPVLFVN